MEREKTAVEGWVALLIVISAALGCITIGAGILVFGTHAPLPPPPTPVTVPIEGYEITGTILAFSPVAPTTTVLDFYWGREAMQAMITQGAVHHETPPPRSYLLTYHAQKRMSARSLSHHAVNAALTFGRIVHARGAEIHVIGRKEIAYYRPRGIDLSPFEGIHLICSSDGTVITLYRNRDLRSLRPHRRPRRRDFKWSRMPHDAA